MATAQQILADYIKSNPVTKAPQVKQINPAIPTGHSFDISPYVAKAPKTYSALELRQQKGTAILQQLKDSTDFSLGGNLNPLVSEAYKSLIKEQRTGANLIPNYEQSSTTHSKSNTYVDNIRDFESWAKTLYGYDANLSTNFNTLAKQYNYNQSRASRDLFPIEFSDPSYDPDQYSTLQNEYYQYATQEMPKKGDPRMAQYNFPVWINKQYPTDPAKVEKERAALLGITYVKDMVVPKYNNDAQYYTNLGTPYGIDEEDQKRKIYALPPRAYIELYGPGTANYTDRVMSQEAPQVLQNTQKFSDDYQGFMAELQKLVESDNVSKTNVYNLYDKYTSFSAMDDYYSKLDTYNTVPTPLDDTYDAYKAKELSGTLAKAPVSPILDVALKQMQFGPGFVDTMYTKANDAQTAIQKYKKSQEVTFWDKLKDFIQGSVSNAEEKLYNQMANAVKVTGIKPDIATYDEAVKTQTAKATAQAKQLAAKEKKDDELAVANASTLTTTLKRDAGYQTYVNQGKGVIAEPTGQIGNPAAILAVINNPNLLASKTRQNEYSSDKFQKFTFVTDNEANILRYYYSKGDMSGFNNFVASISDQLDKRIVVDRLADLQKVVDQPGPWGEITAASMSVAYGLAAPASYIDTLFKSNIGTPLASEKINRYSAAQSIALMANQTRQAAGSTSTPTGQFFINTGLSIVDQVVKLPFGPTGALVWMAASAAGTATATALQNGATPLQAAQYGTIYGAIEYATERLPIDNLFKLIDPVKYAARAVMKRPTLITAIKAAMNQAGLEAKEELIAEYADQLTDIWIMGDKSEFWQYVGSLTAGGMNETEAFNRGVVKFFIEQPVVSYAGGWLAGMLMGGGAIGSNYSQMNVLYNQQQQSTMPTEGVQAPQSVPGAEVGNPSTASVEQTQMPVTDVTQATDVAQATPDAIDETSIKNGNGYISNIRIVYDERLSGEARNETTRILVGNKFFNLDQGSQANILAHEVNHNLSNEYLFEQNHYLEIFDGGIFGEKKETSDGKAYWDGIYGDVGANAVDETFTEALTVYDSNPQRLLTTHPDAYNYIKNNIKNDTTTITQATPVEQADIPTATQSTTVNPNGIQAYIATQSQTNNVPATTETRMNIPQSAINTRTSTQNAESASQGKSNISPAIHADVNSAVSYAQKNGNAKNAKSLSVIVQAVKDWLGSPINTAIFKRPKGARVTAQMEGWYQEYQDAIGLKELYALPTLFHEIGHKMDAQYGLKSNIDDLKVQYLTDRITKNYKPEEHTSEMVADFFRDYFLDPDAAKQKAPEFFSFVESKLSGTDNTQIANIRQMLADFATQTVAEKLKSQVVTQQQPQGEFAGKVTNALKKWEIGLFDENAPVMAFARRFYSLVGDFTIQSKYSSDVADNLIHNKLFAPPKLDGSHGDTLINESFESNLKFLEKLPNPREARQAFISYLVIDHAIERAEQGKDALPVAVATTEQLIEQRAQFDKEYPVFRKQADKLHTWWNTFIQSWLVDTGLWDQETFDIVKKMYPNYVPFYRQLSSGVVSYGKLGPKGFSGILAPIKGAHKSDLPILEPIASMMQDISKYVSTVNNHNVMIQIVEGFDKHPEGMNDWLIEVNPAIIADKLRIAEVKDIITTGIQDKFGKTEDDAIRFIEEVLPGEYTTLFRKRRMSDGVERNILTLKDSSGKERFFYSENSLFFEGLAGLTPDQAVPFMRGLAKITNTIKATITYMNPFFAVPNVGKDIQERFAWGSHKNPVQFIRDTGIAMVDTIRGNELWDIYGQMGGKGESTSYNFNIGSNKKNSTDIMPYNTLSKGQSASRVIMAPLKAVEAFNNYCEQINRFAEFIAAKDLGLSDIEAMAKVRDVTVNFRRKGKWAKNLDPAILFYNAMMQDYYKSIRVIRDSTGKTRTRAGAKLLAKVFTRFLVSQTMFSMLQAVLHAGDKDYEDLPRNIKDGYWILWKNQDGSFYKFPKPASIVPIFFSAVGERAMEYALGDKLAFEGFGTSMQSQIWPSTIADPLIAIGQNRTWYGGTIENYQDAKVEYQERFDEGTSEFAKTLSDVFGGWAKIIPESGFSDGLSPKEFQYLLDQYTGVIGDIVLPWSTPNTQGNRIAKLVGSRFIVDPVLSNKQMSDFYTYSDTIEEANNTIELSGESKQIKDAELFPRKADAIIGGAIKKGDKLLKDYKDSVNKMDALNLPKAEHAQEARRLRNDLNDQLREINKELVDFKKEYMK